MERRAFDGVEREGIMTRSKGDPLAFFYFRSGEKVKMAIYAPEQSAKPLTGPHMAGEQTPKNLVGLIADSAIVHRIYEDLQGIRSNNPLMAARSIVKAENLLQATYPEIHIAVLSNGRPSEIGFTLNDAVSVKYDRETDQWFCGTVEARDAAMATAKATGEVLGKKIKDSYIPPVSVLRAPEVFSPILPLNRSINAREGE